MDLLLPDDPAAIEIKAVDHPSMDFLRRRTIAAEIESFLNRLGFCPFLDRGGDEYPLAPDDRRGPAAARDRCFPRDALRRAPGIGQPGFGAHSRRLGTAELRPVICGWGRTGNPPGDSKKTYRRRCKRSTSCEHGVAFRGRVTSSSARQTNPSLASGHANATSGRTQSEGGNDPRITRWRPLPKLAPTTTGFHPPASPSQSSSARPAAVCGLSSTHNATFPARRFPRPRRPRRVRSWQ